MFTKGILVRYLEGTVRGGEVYFVRESQYSPTSSVCLTEGQHTWHWANPKDLELVQ